MGVTLLCQIKAARESMSMQQMMMMTTRISERKQGGVGESGKSEP
jgi:hypothetical protein